MTAPNYPQMAHVIPLKQSVHMALKEVASGTDDKDLEEAREKAESKDAEPVDSKIDGESIMILMYQSTVDMTKVFKNASNLFLAGAAKIDGETAIKSGSINKISMRDFEGMVGEYLSNFIVASLMDGH